MTREIGYNVSGGCGATVLFGLNKEGELYADLNGDIYTDEIMLEQFATDCDETLSDIIAALKKCKRRK